MTTPSPGALPSEITDAIDEYRDAVVRSEQSYYDRRMSQKTHNQRSAEADASRAALDEVIGRYVEDSQRYEAALREIEPTLQRLASPTYFTPRGDSEREVRDRAGITRTLLNTVREALAAARSTSHEALIMPTAIEEA